MVPRWVYNASEERNAALVSENKRLTRKIEWMAVNYPIFLRDIARTGKEAGRSPTGYITMPDEKEEEWYPTRRSRTAPDGLRREGWHAAGSSAKNVRKKAFSFAHFRTWGDVQKTKKGLPIIRRPFPLVLVVDGVQDDPELIFGEVLDPESRGVRLRVLRVGHGVLAEGRVQGPLEGRPLVEPPAELLPGGTGW